jgi:hypothetical protein
VKATFVSKEFDIPQITKPENSTYISYTQYSIYQKCPLRWKLKYVDRIKDDKPSIHTVFGNSMHNIIQHYFQVLFQETVKKADALEFYKLLIQELKQNYAADVEKYQCHFSTKEELMEFYLDGLETLNYLRKKRTTYVDRKRWTLAGTELSILIPPVESKPNVLLIGFLDIVFKDKTKPKFYIWDLKTSGKGWNKWDKADETKIAQLLLYKIYFSKQYGIPLDQIEVEFIILKRKIDPDSEWPQRRIQRVKPAQGTISYGRTLKSFEAFVNACFLPDGTYNKLTHYEATAGKGSFNCRFCEFKDNKELCPDENRRNC